MRIVGEMAPVKVDAVERLPPLRVSGDKVAGYGLTALIAGGAGALAVKTGLLMKMWKFFVAIFAAAWKAIVVFIVAVFAWLKRMFNKLMGRREEDSQGTTLEAPATNTEPTQSTEAETVPPDEPTTT